ncbi:MAG: rhodanese-like domain-containing protein [Planctomycetota bacterium]
MRTWLAARRLHLPRRAPTAEDTENDRSKAPRHLDYNDSARYMGLPKERRIVFICQDGGRSLDVASYFIGHKFTDVWTVRGGANAWR